MGGEEWISTMAATRMMPVMHFQLEIATRIFQAPIESKTQNTQFRQITTIHLLKTFYVQLIKFIHAITCASINNISIFHSFFHPLKIQQQSMNQLKQLGSLWGVHIFTSPHGIAPARPACHRRHKSICNACGGTWDFRTSG